MPGTRLAVRWSMSRATFLLVLVAACSEDPKLVARLKPLADCHAAQVYMKEVVIAKMDQAIDERIASYDRGAYCAQWQRYDDRATVGLGTSSGAGAGSGSTPPAPTTG